MSGWRGEDVPMIEPTPPPAPGRAIIIDTREKTPLVFPDEIPTKRDGLPTGDYSISGYRDRFTVERKSLQDLAFTLIYERARFERELERMRAFEFRRVLVVGTYADVAAGRYHYTRSRINPRSIVASVAAFEVRYGVPFIFAANAIEAARRVVDWAHYYVREKERPKTRKGPTC